jgi:CHAT domain-containing protein
LNSGLLLTDGKIDAAEISRCRMKYEEVVLSACASGYRPTAIEGVPLTGDDVVGLPGAFLEAGARAVLVSITKARDDAALHFMTLYHEERARGARPLVALQQTQKELLASGEYPPYVWVGFTAYAGQ